MSNSGAWSGDHYEQLEEMYETIVASEKLSGRTITAKDETRIRAEIGEAYNEVIRCFDKENADPSIITYTINLMKSTVATTNDLRNISQLAVAISESTIGALYLVNELQENERNKNAYEVDINDRDKESKDQEELLEKIDIRLSDDVVEALCSSENEQAFDKLNKRALAGDKDAIIAVDLIRKSIHYLYSEADGHIKAKGRDLGALALVDKLITTGEEAALTSAEQIINVFNLERYDIYDMDKNGQNVINVDKVRDEFRKKTEMIHVTVKPDVVKGLEQESKEINAITTRYIQNSQDNSSVSAIINNVKTRMDTKKFLQTAVALSKTQTQDPENTYLHDERFMKFVGNNVEKVPYATTAALEYLNNYGGKMKNASQLYMAIGKCTTVRKSILDTQIAKKDNLFGNYDVSRSYTQIKKDDELNNKEGKNSPDDDGR